MERIDDLRASLTSIFNIDFRFRCLRLHSVRASLVVAPGLSRWHCIYCYDLAYCSGRSLRRHLIPALKGGEILMSSAKGLYLLLSSIIGLRNIKGTLSYRCNQSVNLKSFPPELTMSKFNFTVSSSVLCSHKTITIRLIQCLLSL